MAHVWMVDAVERSHEGEVLRVRWGLMDTELNRWLPMDPRIEEVIHVVDAITCNMPVWAQMPVGNFRPRLKIVNARIGLGVQTIELEHDSLTVADMVQL